jgi:hypothetical protein
MKCQVERNGGVVPEMTLKRSMCLCFLCRLVPRVLVLLPWLSSLIQIISIVLAMASQPPAVVANRNYILGFAAMAYFAMLSGQGWTAIAG